MDDRPLAASEVVALHRLAQRPDAAVPRRITWRIETEGLLTPARGGAGRTVTSQGRDALARALARPPRLNPDTLLTLAAVDRAGHGGLRGYWPGQPAGWDVARLFNLVRSEPPKRAYATWWLTEAGQQVLSRERAARRAAAPVSRCQALILRSVAVGQHQPAAAARSYTSCHNRGWLTWADPGRSRRPRRELTPSGWQALSSYHRRENLPLHLPVHALVVGHVVRPTRHTDEFTGQPVRVERIETAVPRSGRRAGYILIAPRSHGHAEPHPDRRPQPASTIFEVVDYQPQPHPRNGGR